MRKRLAQIPLILLVIFVSSCAGIKHRGRDTQGKIVIVAGSTSCGKSTTARALQLSFAKKGVPYALFGVDDFMSALPKQWVSLDASSYQATREEGVRLVNADDEKGRKTLLKIGPLVAHLRYAIFAAVQAFADAGINVILEGVVSNEELSYGTKVFANNNLFAAYIDCSLKTAEAREKKRGGFMGLARGLEENFSLPPKSRFDIAVSTDTLTPDEASAKILERLLLSDFGSFLFENPSKE